MTTMSPEIEAGIRPFHVEFAHADIEDLRSRIRATRWPERETVTDDTQGVPLATMEALASYWANEYDFGRVAAQLNLLPQFLTDMTVSTSTTSTSGRSTRKHCR